MKYLITFTLTLTLLIGSCSGPKNDEAVNKEADVELTGSYLDERGCIPSAGYSWSFVKDECVRVWEIGVALIHQGSGDPNYNAYAIYNDDEAEIHAVVQTEVQTDDGEVIFGHEDQHIVLTRNGARSDSHIWFNEEADMILMIDGNGYLQVQDENGFTMYAQEGANPELDVGLYARGIVNQVEDGAYPQFTLHINLASEAKTTTFNLNAEEAELNGADLGVIEGKSVEVGYVVKEQYDLMGIGLKGSKQIENMDSQDGWRFVEGVLDGADQISGGDLPDIVTLWDNRRPVSFEIFIDPDLVRLNGKEVAAWFASRTVNDIDNLKVIE